jgi:alanine racemase
MNENIKLEFVTNNIKKIDKIIKNKSKIGIVFKERYSLTSKMNLSYFAYLLSKNTDLIDIFLFNNLSNAIVARKLGITKPIILLYYISPEEVQLALDNDIEITCPNIEWLKKTLSITNFTNNKLKLHCYYDSKLGREGFIDETELYNLLSEIKNYTNIELVGLGTKFNQTTDEINIIKLNYSSSETMNSIMKDYISTQVDKFNSIINYCKNNNLINKNTKIHAACTREVLAEYIETYYDFVRIGTLAFSTILNPFKIQAETLDIKKIPEDFCIGYFCKHKTTKNITIAYIKNYNISDPIFMYKNIVINPISNITFDPFLLDIDKIKDNIKIGDKIDVISTNIFYFP